MSRTWTIADRLPMSGARVVLNLTDGSRVRGLVKSTDGAAIVIWRRRKGPIPMTQVQTWSHDWGNQ